MLVNTQLKIRSRINYTLNGTTGTWSCAPYPFYWYLRTRSTNYYLSLVPQDLEHTQITPRRMHLKWRKSESPEQPSYEVTATGPRHTVITCSAKNGQSETNSASCEGLLPCTTYNVSIRECDRESGCGEAAVKSFSTMPDRRFTLSELPSWCHS